MSQARNRTALPRGHLLFWYRIESVLGQGGFGITYHAHDTNLHRDVAIKEYLPVGVAVRDTSNTLHPSSDEQAAHYQWGLDRFLTEARVLARFNHRHIVRVMSVFEANNTAYSVMEYENGASLYNSIRHEGLVYDEEQATRLALTLMSGLEAVHAEGFIHRDIKPGNILIRDDGSPVLLDFGSARYAMGDRTQMLTSIVSPGYAPYEQYEGAGERQGPWTDIYGLGATLYVVVSRGQRPVDAIARGNARIQGNPDPFEPASVVGRGRYSRRFLEALDAALEFSPDDRPSSIAEWRTRFPLRDMDIASSSGAIAGAAPVRAWRWRTPVDRVRAWLQPRKVPAEKATSRIDSRGSTTPVRIPVDQRTPGTVFRDPLGRGGDGPQMVVVPAGIFRMGDPSGAGAASERPAREVIIERPFAISVAPITFADYQRFADATQHPMPDDEGWGMDTRPVINVSWHNAQAYAAWLAQVCGLRYRLPTEAEWEYAARAGTSTHYWWGERAEGGHATCDGCGSQWDNAQTSPVGAFPANPFGLVDMLGNVWEWVEDAWHPNHVDAPANASARHGGNEHLRVARGGAWNYEPRHVRCASRVGYTVGHRSSNVGFRIALDL